MGGSKGGPAKWLQERKGKAAGGTRTPRQKKGKKTMTDDARVSKDASAARAKRQTKRNKKNKWANG